MSGLSARNKSTPRRPLPTVQSNHSRLAPGLLWGFYGDSITNGSSSGNFAYSYAPQALAMAGGLVARRDSIEAGTSGENSGQVFARIETSILNNAVEAVCILAGTNDAVQLVSAAAYSANMTAMFQTAKKQGCPVVVCTVPPMNSAATAAQRQLVEAYNHWLKTYAPAYDAEVADVYSAAVDTTSGNMVAGYYADSNVHPNATGHYKIAVEVAKAMRRATRRATAANGLIPHGLVTSVALTNLISDPLVVGGTTQPSGWFEWPGGTGTAPTYSLVTDTWGVLPAGRWAQMDFDATASGGTRRLSSGSLSSAGFAVGDTMLLTTHLQVEDVSGTWPADVIAGNSGVNIQVISQTGAGISGSAPLSRTVGMPNPSSSSVYDIGPIVWPFTVSAGVTSMNLWYSLTLPTGKRAKMRAGGIGVINLTTLGLASLYGWGSAMVNT